MSQLDSGTFQQVKDLVLSGYHLNDIQGLACPTALLPAGTGVESLERFALERFRFRGTMTTTSIEDFVRYSKGYASATEKARCFIDADHMTARSVFNIGTLDNPGHADNAASITLKQTAPFRALLQINGERLKQKQIAEWLEDWSDYLLAFDSDGNTMQISQAAQLFAALRSNRQPSRIMKMAISAVRNPLCKALRPAAKMLCRWLLSSNVFRMRVSANVRSASATAC